MSCIAGERQFGNEDQGWVAHFVYSALRGAPITIYGDGKQVRDVLCVDDLVRAFEAARHLPASTEGRIYNIGGGPENTLSLLELMDVVREITGQRLEVQYDEARPGDQLYYVTDFSKFQCDSGWKPEISPEATVKRIYGFYKKNRELFAVTAERPSMAPAVTPSELAQPA